MAVYHYSAVNRAGEVRSGRVEAATQALAVESLSRDSLMPLQIREVTGVIDLRSLLPWTGSSARGASRDDVVLMTQQLASLTRAGLTLDRALAITSQLAESPAQRRLLEDLMTRVRRGTSFTEALDAHRASFPDYYISMVRAGEAGGALPNILDRLSGLLVRSQETRQKVVSALIYPAILLGMIGVTLILILSFVLPRFQALFADAGSKLPLPTRVVMTLGDAVQNYGIILAAILVFAVLVARRAWRSPDVRTRFDGWVLRRRWLGNVIRKAEASRFARTLGTLVGGGMPVPTSLRIASGSLYNRVLQHAVAEVLRGVTEGQGFAEQLTKARHFPALLIQMARVGEETGHLHQSLLEAADMLDADTQRAIERGLVVLVPLITVLMGALVAALIGSVLVGILSINDLAG